LIIGFTQEESSFLKKLFCLYIPFRLTIAVTNFKDNDNQIKRGKGERRSPPSLFPTHDYHF
jgi:hypothetical protein